MDAAAAAAPFAVNVRPLPHVTNTLSVTLIPLSASTIEGGTLLGSVSVVYPGMIVQITLDGNGEGSGGGAGGEAYAFVSVSADGFVAALDGSRYDDCKDPYPWDDNDLYDDYDDRDDSDNNLGLSTSSDGASEFYPDPQDGVMKGKWYGQL